MHNTLRSLKLDPLNFADEVKIPPPASYKPSGRSAKAVGLPSPRNLARSLPPSGSPHSACRSPAFLAPRASALNSTFGKPAHANPLSLCGLLPVFRSNVYLIIFYLTRIYFCAMLFYVFRRPIRNFRPHFCLPRAGARRRRPPCRAGLANPFRFTTIPFASPATPFF